MTNEEIKIKCYELAHFTLHSNYVVPSSIVGTITLNISGEMVTSEAEQIYQWVKTKK